MAASTPGRALISSATARVALLPHGVVVQRGLHGRADGGRRCMRSLQGQREAELFGALGVVGLVCPQRQPSRREPMSEACHQAARSTVGHHEVGVGQGLRLRHESFDAQVRWLGPEVRGVEVADRGHDVGVESGETGQQSLEQVTRGRVEDRSEGHVHAWPW